MPPVLWATHVSAKEAPKKPELRQALSGTQSILFLGWGKLALFSVG